MTKHTKYPPWITLGYLISRYRLPSNPRWVDLAPRTRTDYQKVFNWLASYHDLALADIDLAVVKEIRDAALEQGTRSLANRALQVMKMLFNWATENRILIYNPAASLKLIERPDDLPDPNRAWTDEECAVMLSEARGGLKVALALGLYAALRASTIVELRWNAYDGIVINGPFKNDSGWRIAVHLELKPILEQTRRTADTIVTNELGEPCKLRRLKREFRVLRDRLVAEGKIKPGLTFEGLRRASMAAKHSVVALFQHLDEHFRIRTNSAPNP